ncbi:MAG TPA: hypothetical protein DEF88_00640 [Porphyromonadaceae bacterium]|nr:hypothetical protein [Porphyromonadaceae bacterium]
MKTLLQINSVINSGSTGRIAEEIGLAAMGEGWRSYIAFGRNYRPSQSHKIRIGDERDMRWHGVQTRLFDRHGLASTRATRKLVEQIRAVKPNVIHLHNIHGYYMNVEVLFDFLTPVLHRNRGDTKEARRRRQARAAGCAGVGSERKGLCDFLELSRMIPPDTVIILVGLSAGQIKGQPFNIQGNVIN